MEARVCCVQCWGPGQAPYAHQASALAAELRAAELVLQWVWTWSAESLVISLWLY